MRKLKCQAKFTLTPVLVCQDMGNSECRVEGTIKTGLILPCYNITNDTANEIQLEMWTTAMQHVKCHRGRKTGWGMKHNHPLPSD